MPASESPRGKEGWAQPRGEDTTALSELLQAHVFLVLCCSYLFCK